MDLSDGPFGPVFAFDDAPAYTTPEQPVAIVLAGAFDYLGGSVRANSVAFWNGSDWIAAGGPQGENIAVLAEDDGTLWVGSRRVGTSRFREGAGWSNPGIQGLTRSLAIDDAGRVFAAGERFTAGTVAMNGVAVHAADGWSELGGGVDGIVHSTVVDGDGRLIVGGEFELAGGEPASNIAMWDGASWQPLGLGTSGPVYSLAITADGHLVAGGEFRFSGLVESNNVARWDGEQWNSLSDGTDGIVRAVHITDSGMIVAGGWFSRAGSVPASNIAVWDGTGWRPLGDGISGRVGLFHDEGVYSLHSIQTGELLAGGNFTRAGTANTRFIARWSFGGVPWITHQPSATKIVCGMPTRLEVGVPQGYNVLYQWNRDGVALQDGIQPSGGEIRGATTPSLTLTNGNIQDAGMYSVAVSNACGEVLSRGVAVTSRTDIDGDFQLTIFDFLAFSNLFDAGDMGADLDGDGRLTVFDFLTFQSDFDSGC